MTIGAAITRASYQIGIKLTGLFAAPVRPSLESLLLIEVTRGHRPYGVQT
jgi:hypothetical protein